jgi:hypothetical protein
MTDILNYISTWSIFKWVALVLIAGFIGQFGKMLAEAIIIKIRRRRELKQGKVDIPQSEVQNTMVRQTPDAQEADLPPVLSPPKEPPEPPFASGKMSGKKMLKAIAKAKKKELKKQ